MAPNVNQKPPAGGYGGNVGKAGGPTAGLKSTAKQPTTPGGLGRSTDSGKGYQTDKFSGRGDSADATSKLPTGPRSDGPRGAGKSDTPKGRGADGAEEDVRGKGAKAADDDASKDDMKGGEDCPKAGKGSDKAKGPQKGKGGDELDKADDADDIDDDGDIENSKNEPGETKKGSTDKLGIGDFVKNLVKDAMSKAKGDTQGKTEATGPDKNAPAGAPPAGEGGPPIDIAAMFSQAAGPGTNPAAGGGLGQNNFPGVGGSQPGSLFGGGGPNLGAGGIGLGGTQPPATGPQGGGRYSPVVSGGPAKGADGGGDERFKSL